MPKYKKSEAAAILSQLEALATRMGIKLRYENLKDPDFYIEGGGCRIEGENHIIVHSKLELEDKIEVISRELRKTPLDNVYLAPLLRSVIFGDEELPLDIAD
jgi:hypothetical protein